MDIITEPVYRAYDGKIFLDEVACLQYEKSKGFELIDEDGSSSFDCESPIVLITNENGRYNFNKFCSANGVTGLDSSQVLDNELGMYIWDGSEFIFLDEDTQSTLSNFFKNNDF